MDEGLTRRRALLALASAGLLALSPEGAAAPPYEDVRYRSGPLSIQAYLYRPPGAGPFPLILYNHGSREGQERVSVPWVRICGLFTAAGYAVLASERRGYGRSDGETWSDAVGRDLGPGFVDRCEAEADDVMAGLAFALGQPGIDRNRVGIIGWSLGGIVTLFAAARSGAFRAAVSQAGGDLTWRRSAALRTALHQAVLAVRCPVLLMDDANDAAPEALPDLADSMASAGLAHKLIMYPAFSPSRPTGAIAPGHAMFGPEGLAIWGRDAVAFLDAYVRG